MLAVTPLTSFPVLFNHHHGQFHTPLNEDHAKLTRSENRNSTLPIAEGALLDLTVGVAVAGGTAPSGLLLAVGLPAAKGTTQVLPAGIARMGEQENTAVPAPGQAGSQVRLGAQHRSQEQIILQYQGGYRPPTIPVHPKLKMLRNPYCKKPKLSLRMLT